MTIVLHRGRLVRRMPGSVRQRDLLREQQQEQAGKMYGHALQSSRTFTFCASGSAI